MLYITVAFVFIGVMVFSYFLLVSINQHKIEMADRINSLERMDKAWLNTEDEYGESVASVMVKGFGSFVTKLSPQYKNNRTKKLLEKAGVLRETTFEKWVARKAIITFVIVIGTIVGTIVLVGNAAMAVLFGVLFGLLVNTMYKFYISKRIGNRSVQIVKSLPYSLDLITVSVEAGLSLDGAIGRIVNNIEGPLSDEFGQTLKEMRMGIEKKEALKNMSDRVGNKDLSMLLSSLIQADEMGVSLGKILRIEGGQLREKRKQAAREKAMKAPVKMLFPLMLFIFPTIFVIILGPAIIQFTTAF